MTHLTDTELAHRQAYMDSHGGSLDGYTPLPRKPRRRNLESECQRALIKWWRMACRGFGVPEILLFSIPNGGGGGEMRGHWLKLEGQRKGAPDLFLAVGKRPHTIPVTVRGVGDAMSALCNGLFLELKTPTGRLSPEQEVYHGHLRAAGYRVEVCRTVEDAQRVIMEYLK